MSDFLQDWADSTVNIPIEYSTPSVGGETPWLDKGLGLLFGLGSAYGAVQLQKNEINNAYKLAALQRGVYGSPGAAYTGPTPWLGITGNPGAPGSGGIMPGAGTAGFFGDPMMMMLMLSVVGIGAFVLLRK